MIIKQMFSKVIILSLAIVLYLCSNICVGYADPVCEIPFNVQQSNGETITVLSKGDEFLNWLEDEDGNLLVYENGDYYYANWSEDGPVSNGVLASEEKVSISGVNETENNIKNTLIEQANQERITMNEYYSSIAHQMLSSVETQGVQLLDDQDARESRLNSNLQKKVIVIYVNWEDQTGVESLNVLDKETIVERFFTGEKSVNAYYKAAFDSGTDVIVPAVGDGNPQDSVIYVTLDGAHPKPDADTQVNLHDTDSAAIIEASKQIDVKALDTDNDNNLCSSEAIFAVLYHGYHAGSNGTKFPGINGGVYDTQRFPVKITEDDKTIYVRSFLHASTHINSNPFTIGTIAHEIGHTGFGFGDQYYGNYNTGYWSLMGQGMWSHVDGEVSGTSPSYVDAYSLVNSGVVIPGILSHSEYNEYIIKSPAQIYKVTTNDSTEKQYFLLQQRYKTGIFDMTAFKVSDEDTAGGMLIYHIDDNEPYYYKIATVEEAHGGGQHIDVHYGDKDDLWGTDKVDFAKWTDPSSNLYDVVDSETTSSSMQNTYSGVRISKIFWDPINKQTSFAVGFPEGTITVSTDKQYNVTFNYPIQRTTINSENIYVKDSNNKLIAITWTISDDNKSILIYPPEGGYPSQLYTLVVGGEIMSIGGNKLGQDKIVEFVVD